MQLHLAILLLLFNPPHGDLDKRIAALSTAIAQYPDSTLLYLQRGEVYVLHEDYTLALNDFKKCKADGISNARLAAGFGQCYYAAAETDSSLHYFDLALHQDPDLFSVKEAKARLLALMQQPCAGALLYDEILRDATQPGPSLFIDASLMWMQCEDASSTLKSIQRLEDGIARLGSLHVLQKELVRRYVALREYDKALHWQSKIVEASSSASPLLDRASLHILSGNTVLAKQDVQTAIDKLQAVPSHRKDTQGFQQLQARASTMMNQLNQ